MDAVDGFDRFQKAINARLDKTEKRLDECDDDRADLRNESTELKSEVSTLKSRIRICEDDRADLRKQVNRHSIEFEKLQASNVLPEPPHRTTQERPTPLKKKMRKKSQQ